MGHHWQHDPVLVLIRDIRNSEAFEPVVRRHVLNWIDSFREGLPQDPITQVTASLVCRAYATHARLANACMKLKPTSKDAAQVMKMEVDAGLHLLKCLRIGGFRARANGAKKGGLPTAPRPTQPRAPGRDADLPRTLADAQPADGTAFARPGDEDES